MTIRMNLPQFRAGTVMTWAAAVAAAGSGVLNLLSVMPGPLRRTNLSLIRSVFPLEFRPASEIAALLAGFFLITSSFQLLHRKRRAYYVVAGLGLLSAVLHTVNGLSPLQAVSSLALFAMLAATRRRFTVRSHPIALSSAAGYAVAGALVAAAYGVAGFWLLDPKEFGVNFHWWDACVRTLRLLSFSGDDTLVARTRFAAWFIDSLYALSAAAIGYGAFVLFQPVKYRLSTAQRERQHAADIASRHGRSGQDFFKQWDDKSLFFSASGQCFLAYRVAHNFAVTLGDPVGPEDQIEDTIRQFCAFCDTRGWRCGFHQIYPDHLDLYQKLGFRQMKIGEEAVVDLEAFSLSGKGMKEFRNTVNRLARLGIEVVRYEPPLGPDILRELKEISDEWLQTPGRRERRFTLGRFDPDYVGAMPIYAAVGPDGRLLAFVNLIPCYRSDLASIDLMRRRTAAPNGVMDLLFARVFLDLKEQGVKWFSLGLAPLSGAQTGEHIPVEQRTAYYLLQRFPSLFRFEGLRQYKAKYASVWEPRYDAYQSVWDLPRLGVALSRVSEIPSRKPAA